MYRIYENFILSNVKHEQPNGKLRNSDRVNCYFSNEIDLKFKLKSNFLCCGFSNIRSRVLDLFSTFFLNGYKVFPRNKIIYASNTFT